MALAHSQVIVKTAPDDPERDYSVSNVWHTIGSVIPSDIDWDNHAQEVLDAFTAENTTAEGVFDLYGQRDVTVKVYDHDDPKPRLPKAIKTHARTGTLPALGPRDVQLCLSFYHLNPSVRSERGRIYIGPWYNARMKEHPDAGDMGGLLSLGHQLFDIGGENVAHVVYSVTHNTTSVIQHYWVNNSWDTMRSRDTKETARVTLAP